MKTRAAVAFEAKKPLEIVEVDLEGPKAGEVLVEIKAVKHPLPVHEAQILSYLRLAHLPLGLLINFHCATLKAGLRRFQLSAPSIPSVLSTANQEGDELCPHSKRN